MSVLQGARVVLYVTGGIAAYKASDLASKLTQAGTKWMWCCRGRPRTLLDR